MAETGPIQGDLTVYLDTDNPFDFPIEDENGVRLDVTGWTADFHVDQVPAHTSTKLTVAASVAVDPDDGTKTVLHVLLSDDLLQPGTDPDEWPVYSTKKKYPYSLKRTNPGAEKILRFGQLNFVRVRE